MKGVQEMKDTAEKKAKQILTAFTLALTLAACGSTAEAKAESSAVTATLSTEETASVVHTVSSQEGTALDTADMFTERDLEQSADLSKAVSCPLSSGKNISITEEGVYVLTGEATDVTVTVNAPSDAKVQIVLDNVAVTNTDHPVIDVISADKVFVTTTDGTNTLTVSGTFSEDGDTKKDAVIFSKDDLVLSGNGTLRIVSSDNGITSKDDLKITGGTYVIEAKDHALEANDSIRIADGTLTLTAGKDGIHAGDDDDDTVGFVYIGNGTINISAGDDCIHAVTIAQIDSGSITAEGHEGIEATWVQINGGTIVLNASDDGINATRKSGSYTTLAEFTGGDVTITMASGDTDAVDSNGNLVISGGTINITGQSAFDFDGSVSFTGGTVIVNGKEQTQITGSMMKGQGMGMQNDGSMPQGGMNGGMHRRA